MTEEQRPEHAMADPAESEEVPPPPISFWIMIVLAVMYLGWRLVQGVVWLIERVV